MCQARLVVSEATFLVFQSLLSGRTRHSGTGPVAPPPRRSDPRKRYAARDAPRVTGIKSELGKTSSPL